MGNGKGSEDEDVILLRSDRRNHLRKSVLVLKIKGEGKKGVFFGYANTLGKGGMFITTVNPMEVGSEFDISFRLHGMDHDIRLRCAVAWRRQYDPATLKHEPGMGIKFLDLDEKTSAEIVEWLNKK